VLNHARTLLMNVAGDAAPGTVAEELVDPAFRPVAVPTPLAQVRRALFGADPDRDMLNFRCRQLLAVVHATPLAAFLTALDPRVTYGFDAAAAVDPAAWVPTVRRLRGTGTLTVLGEPEAPDATGRVRHALLVSVDTPATARVERTTRPLTADVRGYAANARVPLAGTGCDFRLAAEGSGQAYAVEVLARPRLDVGGLAAAAGGLGEPVYAYLFGITNAEPYRTFRALWTAQREVPLRLAGLVCALVYRSEEVRAGA